MRISGVPVGKVKTIEPDKQTGRSIAVDRARVAVRAAALATPARSCARRRCWARPTSSSRRAVATRAPVPEGRHAGRSRRSPTPSSSTRSSARSTPRRARRSRPGCRTQARGIGGYGRDLNDALGNLAPFAEDTAQLLEILNRRRAAVRSLVSQHRRGVRRADRARRPAAVADRELQPRVRDDRARATTSSRRRSSRCRRSSASPTLTLKRLAEFADDTDPLVTQLRPAARELSPTLQDLGALSPDLEALFRELDPLIDASRDRLPGARARASRTRARCIGQLDPAMRQLNPILDFVGLYKAELTAFFANTRRRGTQAEGRRAGVHYLRTTNPLNAENLAVYPRRIGTNRPNPYAKPGNFNQLAERPAGVREPPLRRRRADGHQRARSAAPADRRRPRAARSAGPRDPVRVRGRPAAARRRRAASRVRYDFGGEVTQYPHVNER